jgi:hypothetical protein
MQGCQSGIIVGASAGADKGLLALYRGANTSDALNGSRMTDVCFGSYARSGAGNQLRCVQNLEQHGTGMVDRPTLLVRETRITGVRVRSNATVTCPRVPTDFFAKRTCVGLVAQTTATAGFFDACFTPNSDIDQNSRPPSLSFTLKNGGYGWMQPPKIWPATAECRCGTGLTAFHFDEVTGRGSGYAPEYGGTLTVVSAPPGAEGFAGTFMTDASGR